MHLLDGGIDVKASETLTLIYEALRELFQNKSELRGVDDWDSFIGILLKLKEVETAVQIMEEKQNSVEENEGE